LKQLTLHSFKFFVLSLFLALVWVGTASTNKVRIKYNAFPPDSIDRQDTGKKIPYPFHQDLENPIPVQNKSGLYLKDPSNVTATEEYDPATNQYILKRRIGGRTLGEPAVMSFDDYQKLDQNRSLQNYWRQRSSSTSKASADGIIPPIRIGGEVFDRIFGSNTIDIRPQGSAELIFGILSNKREDPALSVRQRRTTNFDFQEKIQMNVSAKIGDKIEFQTNYNTEASFGFENKLKLKYEGKEDEIVKLIEAGDVTLPLNSTLINGSQSLFGLKTQLQFGKVTFTGVYSEQKSQTQNITVQGGAQTSKFSIKADEYEENRHYFLSQYFRDNYQKSLSQLPIVQSNINITKIEVWITQIGAAVTDNRNIVAFADLGEAVPYNKKINNNFNANAYPSNETNNLFSLASDTSQLRNVYKAPNYLVTLPYNFVAGQDFEVVESARKLSSSEFTFNSKLGFISLNSAINSDQVLAVSYQYTVIGENQVYQVGEFSDQGINTPGSLRVKLLKSTALNTKLPMWNLMMKNVYNIGAYQVNSSDFVLNILYSGNDNGVPTGYFTEGPLKGTPLLQVFNFDNLTPQSNPPHDGMFDFIDGAAINGGTIQSSSGRVYFTMLEPFGSYLRDKLNDPTFANKYCYDSLYTMTKTGAQQYPAKNKYVLDGMYKSSAGSEISLNALNVPQGSVKVTAGGTPLTENVDYTVDYTLGRVRIINEGILNSGTPVNISLENNAQFNIQTQRLMGAHVDYAANKDLSIGATILNMRERPLTQKTNFGDDPISNTIWGMDASYQTESRWLTKMLDKLPFYSTKAPSKITFNGEFAQFIPGHSKAIGKSGTSYIDDFEGAKSTIDLKSAILSNWFMASTPEGQTEYGMFPEAAQNTGIKYGFNRAKLAWYIIDPLFYDRTGNLKPANVDKNELSKNAVRYIRESEIFPNIDPPNGQPTNIPVFNLAYYPQERGPNNYDITGIPGVSQGLNADGTLRSPETRWGGIMRKMETTDFEATNVEYIEFWMMDPFADDTIANPPGGDLYFNLGDISEDILRDGRKSYENGLPTSADVSDVDTTIWGRVPRLQALVSGFSNDAAARKFQDVGYDGLGDDDERLFFYGNYLKQIESLYGTGSEAYLQAYNDPSADDYHYFRGSDYDKDVKYKSILERYKQFNGPEGNSPTGAIETQATNLPNVEDINKDNTLSTGERYFQYKVELRPEKMTIGQNYISDIYTAQNIPLDNGKRATVKWYQFKIPIHSPDKVVGNIQDFKSIRFMRMFFKGFIQPVVCRFATFELVRGEWRKYDQSLLANGEYIPNDEQNETQFDISAVSIEENGSRKPIPYVLPPDIEREVNLGTTNMQKLNEQSIDFKVTNLMDGDARGAFKTTDFDFRQYKRLKMYVHAEEVNHNDNLKQGDLTVFIRMGSDFTQNYYEYEVPVSFTPWYTSSANAEAIWPDSNSFNIELSKLVDAKELRNNDIRKGENSTSTSLPYVVYDGNNKISVVGTPSLSDIKALMIGVRNPKKRTINDTDDGMAKNAEIWLDELRLTDFNEKSGFAATGRIATTLADLGTLTVSGSHSTPGFGSIEKKINDRQKETITNFDIATNLELGKFFPEKSGIRIPMHFDYSESRSNPQYNPLDPDILYKDQIKDMTSQEKDSLKKRVQDFTMRKNINFMNVRKEKVGASKKNHVYDIENFDLTYAYSEIYHRNIDIDYNLQKTYRGGIGYNFINQPKIVKPLDKIKFLTKYKAFQILKDFNFYYMPKVFSFRTDMNREYSELKYRNKSDALVLIEPSYVKKWDWNRTYDLKFDLTQGLKVEYHADANAYIDEPAGRIDKHDVDYKAKRDSIIDEILGFGTLQRFNQTSSVSYNIPINKLPLLNWVTLTTQYRSVYRWEASPVSLQERMGNTIENSNTKQLNGAFKLTGIYSMIPFLKNLDDGKSKQSKGPGAPNMKKMMPKKAANDTIEEIKPKVNYVKIVSKTVLGILTGFKDVSFSYSENNGTLLPGFTPKPDAFGNRLNDMAPGLGFVFGSQKDIRYTAADNGWLSMDSLLNNAMYVKRSKNLTIKGTIEPIPDFRIDLNADRTENLNHQEYFLYSQEDGRFVPKSAVDNGSFTISYNIWGTAFEKDSKDNKSATFEKLKSNRLEIAKRLAQQNPNWNQQYDSTGFPVGYGSKSQEVLMASFLAAYSGKSASSTNLNPFPKIPKPNWRITYNGLSKIEFLSRYLKNITISHAYRSTYSVASYRSNILYHVNPANGHADSVDAYNNFRPQYQIDVVTITEQFSPLIGFDLTWVNNLSTRAEYKKSRNLALSFVNNQLTEIRSSELVFGLGYRFKNMEYILKTLGVQSKKTKVQSDLNIKCDVSIRNNKTILRRVDENIDQISAGQKLTTINFSADYMMSQNFNLRFFFEKSNTNPFISSQYPNSTTNAGISLRFTLAQ